jgi:hypothetical protein
MVMNRKCIIRLSRYKNALKRMKEELYKEQQGINQADKKD